VSDVKLIGGIAILLFFAFMEVLTVYDHKSERDAIMENEQLKEKCREQEKRIKELTETLNQKSDQ